mgnify:CR=1 FL=1
MQTTVILARMFHELALRDYVDGCATGLPQGVGPVAYFNSTSQGPTPEDARKDAHICGRSRKFMKHPGQASGDGWCSYSCHKEKPFFSYGE